MLRVVEASETLPVTLDLAKAHLMVEADDQDELIETYLRAAVQFFEHQTTRCLTPTVYELRLDEWPCEAVELPVAPVRSVISVSYIDEDGEEQVLGADAWDWEYSDFGAAVMLDAQLPKPVLGRERGGFRIGFIAGYDVPGTADSPPDANLSLPQAAKAAVMQLTQHWFENRSTVSAGEAVTDVPFSTGRMIAMMRIWR